MGWRNCAASMTLVGEINARWPRRDKASDGTIGDAAHASRNSDHNPWVVVAGTGVVRARDIDKDGIDAPWLAEWLRRRGEAGDPRLTGGGYVIFNRRITSPDFRGWRAYTGSNPHVAHVHVSFSRNAAGFDSRAPWGLGGGTAVPAGPATSAPHQEDDMTPEQAQQLALLVTQLVTGPDPKTWGWPTFPGGSNDRFTVVDYLRKQNQRSEDVMRELANLRTTVNQVRAGAAPTGGPVALTAADVQRIAAAVLDPLSARTATPKGT